MSTREDKRSKSLCQVVPSLGPEEVKGLNPKEREEKLPTKVQTNPPALVKEPDILKRFGEAIEAWGVVGETRAAKLIYLATTSRLCYGTGGQVSLVTKAQSSAGKSYLDDNVTAFFPDDAVERVSSMSPKALAYAEDLDLAYRTLYVREASGLGHGDGAALLRTLMTEGRIDHRTVVEGKGQHLEMEGPVQVLVTTTVDELDPELETRILTVTLNESPEQTKAVMRAQARLAEHGAPGAGRDLERWRELQRWLGSFPPEQNVVRVPFAGVLVELIPPAAVRMRRDHKALLNLVKAHALLHRATRETGPDGEIIAELRDYATVRELVADLMSEGVEVSVKPELRETVEAVRAIHRTAAVSQTQIREKLGRDKSTVSRRVREAISKGYLIEVPEPDNPKRFKVKLGDPLPDGGSILPTVQDVEQSCEVARGCKAVA